MPPVESDADLESFFDEDEFATSVETPRGPLSAIFDKAFQMSFTDPGIEGTVPVLTCNEADVVALELVKDDLMRVSVKRGGSTKVLDYKFVRHEPDGTGVSILVLKK